MNKVSSYYLPNSCLSNKVPSLGNEDTEVNEMQSL